MTGPFIFTYRLSIYLSVTLFHIYMIEEGKQAVKAQAYAADDDDSDILPKEFIDQPKVVEKDEWDLSNIE